MGLLVDGEWRDQWYDTRSTGGRFKRDVSRFRNWITADGRAGPSGASGFQAEAGRYHLYVSYACPWAHRTLIFRKLKGLEDMISVSVVHWYMAENGWTFADGDGVVPDPIHDADYLYQVYQAADASYTGRVTVPVLWDKTKHTIVSNESADIIRMFNSAFDGIGATEGDYYPEDLREEIDEINARVYTTVNNGVYKAGFATTQEAYEEAVEPLFESLEWLDGRLSTQRYACSRHYCASTRCTLATSSATAGGSWISRTCGPTFATCTRSPAWPRRCTWITSSRTITAATKRSIRPASCPSVRISTTRNRTAATHYRA
jgi:putative glutathione S-transferase